MSNKNKVLFAIGILLLNGLAYSTSCIELLPIDTKIVIENPLFEHALKEIHDDAFNAVYGEGNWSNMFDHYLDQYKQSDNLRLIIALKDDFIAGWVLFKKCERTAIVELLCIDPHFWRQGVGKKLIFGIVEYSPDINHMALVTRKINRISPHFYESLGFKKTDFTLPEYAAIADTMQGYEYHT